MNNATQRILKRTAQGLALGLVLFDLVTAGGCSDMTFAGLRIAPAETQKQAATAADDLAIQLAATGSRPGSAAGKALAKMTRPAATYTGPPATPIDLTALAAIEAGQWRYKDDQVKAARMRDDLRGKAMSIASVRLADLADAVTSKDVDVDKVVDQVAAIATIAAMADELAATIPEPVTPDSTRSPELKQIADATAAALDKLSGIATAQAAARPDVAEVVDKGLASARKTVDKAAETARDAVSIWQEYAPEFISILGAVGLGAGGYAVKKRRDANKAIADGTDESAKIAEALASVARSGGNVAEVAEAIGTIAKRGGDVNAAAESAAILAATSGPETPAS